MVERQSNTISTAPSSNFFSFLPDAFEHDYNATEGRMRRSDEFSSRSSELTALPKWDEKRSVERPKTPISFPRRVHNSHGRTSSKYSETPIPDDGGYAKESGYAQGSGRQSRLAAHLIELGLGPWGSSTIPPDPRLPPDQREAAAEYNAELRRRNRNLAWLVAAVVFIIMLAITLGMVLSTYVQAGSPGATFTGFPAQPVPTPTSTPSGAPIPSPTSARIPRPEMQLASISVTGLTEQGSEPYNSVSIFWQNRDGFISRTTHNSSTGEWVRTMNFVKAKKNTPIAAATVQQAYYEGEENYSFAPGEIMTSIVYLDDQNYLNEWTFSSNDPQNGKIGSLNERKVMAHPDTQISFFWPNIVYQGPSGELRTETYECLSKDQCWQERVLDTGTPLNGTSIVTLPSGNNLSATSLFFQDESGNAVYYVEDQDRKSQLWRNEAFSNIIPVNATLASFATRRAGSSEDESLNVYLLWQDVNGTIQMSWTDGGDGSQWKGPITQPAFAGADKDAALSCMTGPTFKNFPLGTGHELSRCYFQTGLGLREISFDGAEWKIEGVIPIDR